MLYLSYVDLTPGLENKYSTPLHHPIINVLRKHYVDWTGFFNKYPDYNLGFTVVTKKDTMTLDIKGPSISKKLKIVDFSIFLPQEINSMKIYLDNVFEGLNSVFKKYNIVPTDSFNKDVDLLYQTLAQ